MDDNSNDNTADIVPKLMMEAKRIKIYSNPYNRGTLYTRSLASYLSCWEYMTLLDPDDLLFNKEILEKSYKKAFENNIDIIEFMR